MNNSKYYLKWGILGMLINLAYTILTLFLFPVGNCHTNSLCGMGWAFVNIHNTLVVFVFDFFNLHLSFISEMFAASLITGIILGLIISKVARLIVKLNERVNKL